jgi:hypothetical protein
VSDAPKRLYTQDEVNAILSRAVERQQPDAELTLDEIVAAAREAGLSAEAVERAAHELDEDRDARALEQRGKKRATRAWVAHLVTYASIVSFLVLVNVMTTHVWWAQWPALGWGLALLIHTLAFFLGDAEEKARKARRRVRKADERREARRARHERKRAVESGARDLGQAVERAAATLMAAAAKKINEEVDRARADKAPSTSDGVRRARVDDAETEAAAAEQRARVMPRDEDELEDDEPAARRARRRG